MAATPRLLVCDLDGTLVDSLPDIAAALNRMLARRRIAALSHAEVMPMVGDGLQPLIQRAFAARSLTPDDEAAAEYLLDYESNVLVETRLFPGVLEAMTRMAGDGWRFAVCTNKPERAARRLLEALGLAPMLAAIGGGDSYPARKPDPLHFQATVTAAGGGAAFERAVMVGDHSNDIEAARGSGARAVFAGWGYGRPGMAAGADAVCPTPAGLPDEAARLLPV